MSTYEYLANPSPPSRHAMTYRLTHAAGVIPSDKSNPAGAAWHVSTPNIPSQRTHLTWRRVAQRLGQICLDQDDIQQL